MRFNTDMTMMFAVHDALRREVECLARATARADDDPRQVLRTAAGWEMFKSYLHVHHTAEDDLLWPPLRLVLPADSDGAALLDALEVEHAVIDPLLEAIDGAVVDPGTSRHRLAELVDALTMTLRGHLDHEERDGLPVIDSVITAEQWNAFSAEGARLIGGDVGRFMPWMLQDASPEMATTVLGLLPPPVRTAYVEQWQPAYAALERWG